jgi:hypothetical protein
MIKHELHPQPWVHVQEPEKVEYDQNGRMLYHPVFHPNHQKPWTESDLEYLCKYWEVDHHRTLAFALGRTEQTLEKKVSILKKRGLFDYYKNLNRYW